MICDRCLDSMKRWGWHNNQRLCENCLHNSRPATWRVKEVEDLEPTLQNLKKLWEK